MNLPPPPCTRTQNGSLCGHLYHHLLGRFAEPSAAALFPEGQTFEDNAYTRYIELSSTLDRLVDKL